MAPTAAMLLLSHNAETHAPSVTMPPSSSSPSATTYSVLKWVVNNSIPNSKAASNNNNQIQTRCVAAADRDPSAAEKSFEEALQLCSC